MMQTPSGEKTGVRKSPQPKRRAVGRQAGQETLARQVAGANRTNSKIKGAKKAPMPRSLSVELATLVTEAPDGDDWMHEIKLDGYRMLCRIAKGSVRFISRNGHDWTSRFAALGQEAAILPAASAIIDGEVVVLDGQGRSSFQTMQNAFKGEIKTAFHFYVFDLLFLNGYDLQTYLQIKSQDWAAVVIAGGTSPAPNDPQGKDMSPASFLGAMYLWGAKGFFDAFGHHPYSFPCSPATIASWNAFQQTLTLRWIMGVHGEGNKRIWATEIGAPTGSDVGTCGANNGVSVTEPMQALLAGETMQIWIKDWSVFTGPMFWYMIRDAGTNRAVRDDNFGLVHRNFAPKQAFYTFAQMLRG